MGHDYETVWVDKSKRLRAQGIMHRAKERAHASAAPDHLKTRLAPKDAGESGEGNDKDTAAPIASSSIAPQASASSRRSGMDTAAPIASSSAAPEASASRSSRRVPDKDGNREPLVRATLADPPTRTTPLNAPKPVLKTAEKPQTAVDTAKKDHKETTAKSIKQRLTRAHKKLKKYAEKYAAKMKAIQDEIAAIAAIAESA